MTKPMSPGDALDLLHEHARSFTCHWASDDGAHDLAAARQACRDVAAAVVILRRALDTNPTARLEAELAEAELKAWDSLARYKFAMFGYWAGIWVHLNRVGDFRRPNPFRSAVALARDTINPPPLRDDPMADADERRAFADSMTLSDLDDATEQFP